MDETSTPPHFESFERESQSSIDELMLRRLRQWTLPPGSSRSVAKQFQSQSQIHTDKRREHASLLTVTTHDMRA